jgi:hypothetical protein
MIRKVIVLAQAELDIRLGMDFYEQIEPGVGDYFKSSISDDLRRLDSYFGQHAVHCGFHRALSERFPFAIYYRDRGELRQVVAVLDMRRDPAWLRRQLGFRKSS